jgi:hypothetical protein
MSPVAYTLDVDKLVLNPATGQFDTAASPIRRMAVNLVYDGSHPFPVTFDGFKLTFDPIGGQIGFELVKPGHPMNGSFGIAFGTMNVGGTHVFVQFELALPVSNTEKYAIRLEKV